MISGVSWAGVFARGRGFRPPLARLLLRLLELLGADLGRHTVAVLSGGGNSTKKRMLNSDKRAPLVCKRTSVDAGSENR